MVSLWYFNIAVETHHYQWENPLFLWSFSIAMLNYQRLNPIKIPSKSHQNPIKSHQNPIISKIFMVLD